MSAQLKILRAGPGLTVQDMGRTGHLAQGLSRGGAADRIALHEGAALLGQPATCAAIEMIGMGGEFEASHDLRIALTGAPMTAMLDGAKLAWHASHLLPAGVRLSIGPAQKGTCGYLHIGGGLDTPEILGARSAHLAAGIGTALEAGQTLPVGKDSGTRTGLTFSPGDRFSGGTIRLVASAQTRLFSDDAVQRLHTTGFRKDSRANRMGARLEHDGTGFALDVGRSVVSEIITPGDIQITGDGTPFVLLCEAQTTGGYPRIASVLPCDLPRIAQAPAGAALTFRLLDLAEAVAAERTEAKRLADLPRQLRPLVRDPHDIRDLLGYQLVSGVTAGDDTSPPPPEKAPSGT